LASFRPRRDGTVVSDLSHRVDGLDSFEGQNELTKQDLTRADLEQAITVYERAEMTRNPHRHQRGRRVRIEPRGLDPDQPDAFAEPLIVIPWVQTWSCSAVARGDHRQADFETSLLTTGPSERRVLGWPDRGRSLTEWQSCSPIQTHSELVGA
jgi:hypothetical protein